MKIAIIGGTSGIGLAVAKKLMTNNTITIIGRSQQNFDRFFSESKREEINFIQADILLDQGRRKIIAKMQQIDYLLYVAGIHSSFSDMMTLHALGMYFIIRSLLQEQKITHGVLYLTSSAHNIPTWHILQKKSPMFFGYAKSKLWGERVIRLLEESYPKIKFLIYDPTLVKDTTMFETSQDISGKIARLLGKLGFAKTPKEIAIDIEKILAKDKSGFYSAYPWGINLIIKKKYNKTTNDPTEKQLTRFFLSKEN